MDSRKVQSAKSIGERGMQMVTDGKVRDHKLANSARVHTGEVEEKEAQQFRDFLPSKNCRIVWELTGSECV